MGDFSAVVFCDVAMYVTRPVSMLFTPPLQPTGGVTYIGGVTAILGATKSVHHTCLLVRRSFDPGAEHTT